MSGRELAAVFARVLSVFMLFRCTQAAAQVFGQTENAQFGLMWFIAPAVFAIILWFAAPYFGVRDLGEVEPALQIDPLALAALLLTILGVYMLAGNLPVLIERFFFQPPVEPGLVVRPPAPVSLEVVSCLMAAALIGAARPVAKWLAR